MYEYPIRLSKEDSVKEIQDQFSRRFSFLRIHFFKNSNPDPGLNRPRVILFSPDVALNDINPKMTDGELSVHGSVTVLELDRQFYEKFGLSVQILRKSGNLWLDTSRTNSWTLKEQDDHGREISPDQITNGANIRGSGYRRSHGQ
jgi:hypothetical protein